jgi:hypothetical protein
MTATTVKSLKLPQNALMSEILELTSKQKSNQKKVEVLQENRHPALVSLLIWQFDESLVSVLPEGPVPYGNVNEQTSGNDNLSTTIDKQINNSSKMDMYLSEQKTTIRNEYTIFYNFIRGGNDSLSRIRRETMFINLLEGLDPREAELLILVKDKLLTTKYKITKQVVSDAYPDIQWNNRV